MMETRFMSSTDLTLRLCICIGVVGLMLAPASGQQKPASAVVCPAVLTATETAAPTPGWDSEAGKVQHAFERISVFNGKAGGPEFELAPDGQKQDGTRVTQTWTLKAYRTMKIFLRCRYHDTPVVYFRDLPAEVATCTLRFTADGRGKITGRSEMECR
jgi:hypothetical protein